LDFRQRWVECDSSPFAGSGFPVYKGAGSALQRGLINWFLDVHTRENGMTEVWPPAVVNTASATGTGQIPDKEDQMYVVTRDELYLVPRDGHPSRAGYALAARTTADAVRTQVPSFRDCRVE
jgi:seryl-tRNA synthetase